MSKKNNVKLVEKSSTTKKVAEQEYRAITYTGESWLAYMSAETGKEPMEIAHSVIEAWQRHEHIRTAQNLANKGELGEEVSILKVPGSGRVRDGLATYRKMVQDMAKAQGRELSKEEIEGAASKLKARMEEQSEGLF